MNIFVRMQSANRFLWCICALVCVISQSTAASSIHFSKNCINAQQALYTLKLDNAKSILALEAEQYPDNCAVDYLMVVHSMLTYITNESTPYYTAFDSIKDAAIKCISAAENEDGTKDFLLEEIYFYASVVNGKKGNSLSAASDVRNCYKHGTKVLKDFPDYHAAKKTIGLLQSGFGSLPNTYQKLVQFFGYESSMDVGLASLNEFIQCKETRPEWALMKKEAQFFMASIYLYLKNDKVNAWSLVDSLTSDYTINPLSSFARVNFADKCHRNDEIIRVIAQTPTTQPYSNIPFLSLMMGKAKLNHLDADADQYLQAYLKGYKGSSYIKSCYQKLSWHALINDDINAYRKYVGLIKSNGSTALEEDEQAQKFANLNVIPDVSLLKTRLLFDGGYYQEALEIIWPKKVKDFETSLLKTEYFYRKARVYDALEKENLAEAFYLEAMSQGDILSQYYASYAALYLAELKERQKQFTQAKTYFKKAMSFTANKEYKKSIEHRAKNGLERIDQN